MGTSGRLSEQSTRYIFFDQTDEDGNYKFYTPEHFNDQTKHLYTRTLHEIFQLYSTIVHELTEYIQKNSTTPVDERDAAWKSATRAQACDATRAVLPVATNQQSVFMPRGKP